MKLFYLVIIFIFFQNCSFDNKTGIWKNENQTLNQDNDIFKEFDTLLTSSETFNKIVPIQKNFRFKLDKPKKNFKWNDIFFEKTNNLSNIKYNNLNELLFKSKKISKHKISNFILFDNNYLLVNDIKGNLISFSFNEKKIINKFNFYKKKYKKIDKILNFIVDEGIVYVADNIGYLYALDYKKNSLLWAKNYKIPFRSNIKILEERLVVADQNNTLHFVDKRSGENFNSIPTEETLVKNNFINNLSANDNLILFLNTYGSLYAINRKTMKVIWFLNLNQSLDLNPSNLFLGNQIINYKNKIAVSSNFYTYILDASTGSIIYKFKFSTLIKPVILNNYLFAISKNNLLISLNLKNGKIIYSYDINEEISNFLNTKKKEIQIKDILVANNKIFIFLNNSYFLKFNISGKLENVNKLPTKINTQPILINGSLLYLDNKNQISLVD